jgi:hypothetical protein
MPSIMPAAQRRSEMAGQGSGLTELAEVRRAVITSQNLATPMPAMPAAPRLPQQKITASPGEG